MTDDNSSDTPGVSPTQTDYVCEDAPCLHDQGLPQELLLATLLRVSSENKWSISARVVEDLDAFAHSEEARVSAAACQGPDIVVQVCGCDFTLRPGFDLQMLKEALDLFDTREGGR